ncbi:MAG TPA: CpsB/CapC family capsule biosynthesis tyrosine phosphatase [Gemmatimonadales bacterium]
MIDLHNHLLPNIDDGSRSVEQSVAVLEAFAAAGVTNVVCTPHLKASEISAHTDDKVAERGEAMDGLKAAAPTTPVLGLGFEIMLDEPLPALAMGDRRLSLNGSRYYLVEFPITIVGAFATTVLKQIAASGAVPLVAHPERYDTCSVAMVEAWRAVGAMMQVDATTLTRPTTRGKLARQLVSRGLADIVAADNHGDRRSVATAAAYLEKAGSANVAEWLTVHNPRAILDNRDLRPVPAADLTAGTGWLRRLFSWD